MASEIGSILLQMKRLFSSTGGDATITRGHALPATLKHKSSYDLPYLFPSDC